MKRMILIACSIAGFVTSSFAGGSTQWNPYLNRWEYHNDNGGFTGSANYNPYLGRYEFRNSNGGQYGSMRWNPFLNRWEYGN